MMERVRERADRAFARARLHAASDFDDVVRAVEDAVDLRLRIVSEADTRGWGTLTGFLTVFADRREGSIHVRASDPALYRQFAASHELGHLLDDAHCSGILRERSSISPHDDPTLTTPEFEAELVAEHVAHRIARLLYGNPRIAESSW
jgi:Zn-dependent peptidase ImmA (M78 family)